MIQVGCLSLVLGLGLAGLASIKAKKMSLKAREQGRREMKKRKQIISGELGKKRQVSDSKLKMNSISLVRKSRR